MIKDYRLVEIELFSYCNRKCSWCPNKVINRSFYKELPQTIYTKVLTELKTNQYSGVISYSRYNEPMSNIELLKKRTKQAKQLLPHVNLVTNTNGDYLSKEALKGLFIDQLTIMDYDSSGIQKCLDKLLQCGVEIKEIKYPFIYAELNEMQILYYMDWPKHAKIEDRGGFFTENIKNMKYKNNKQLRSEPCLEPKYFIGIDYTGKVTPCCHIRSDNEWHDPFILGDLKKESLSQILSNEKSIWFKDTMTNGIPSQYPYSCKYCQKDSGRYTREQSGIAYKEEVDE